MHSNKKKFWSVVKSVSKTSNVPSKPPLPPIILTNLMNNYFYSMFKSSLSQEEYDDHLANNVDFIETISDIDITSNEVRYVLLSLDISKATGPDNIPVALLIHCVPYISSSSTKVQSSEECLQHEKFPTYYPSVSLHVHEC